MYYRMFALSVNAAVRLNYTFPLVSPSFLRIIEKLFDVYSMMYVCSVPGRSPAAKGPQRPIVSSDPRGGVTHSQPSSSSDTDTENWFYVQVWFHFVRAMEL